MSQAQKIDKVSLLLYGIRSFVPESIKARADLIVEAFQILENVQKMGTRIGSFKDIITSNIKRG